MKVPVEQVTVARERYDGLMYQQRFLHVSTVHPQLQGCKRCLKFGHTLNACVLLPSNAPKSAPLTPENEALTSIEFAKEWEAEDRADEWPCQLPDADPPCKRKRSEETGIKNTDKSKLNIEKDLIQGLRTAGAAVLGGCRFDPVSSEVVNSTSRVTCGLCKVAIMVKSVQAHMQSKAHQRAAKN